MTTSARFVVVPYPWRATIDVSTPWPSRFYARLISQALRYGNPTRRRFGRAIGFAARTGLPEQPFASLLRRGRKSADPEIRDLIDGIGRAWSDLASRAHHLPAAPSRLSALALQRSGGRTVFIFGDGPPPLVVCKVASDPAKFEAEVRALQQAAPAGAAPAYLGEAGGAFVQEALPGEPLRVTPVGPDNAVDLEWGSEHEGMAGALVSLAQRTRHEASPQELDPEVARAAGGLGGRTGTLLRAALDDLASLDTTVLRHGDTSPQNCMVESGSFQGFVDWELARFDGAPGFDIWNAAVACIDHGVGLLRWSEERALASFKKAWNGSRFFENARIAARLSARAAGVPDEAHDKLEIAFFGRRLASRLARPTHYATGPETAREMLELVCAR